MSVSWKDGIVHQEKDYGVFIYAFPVPIMGVKWSKVRSLSRGQLFATLWTRAYQAPPSTGFSRQDYWSGLPFPSPGDLPDPGIPHCRQMLYLLSHQGSPSWVGMCLIQNNWLLFTGCCCCCQVASVVSNSSRPHGLQPTRLLRPRDSPGKSTWVGCHWGAYIVMSLLFNISAI